MFGSGRARWVRPLTETWVGRGPPIRRMLELAPEGDPPYTGSRSGFSARVGQIRESVERTAVDAMIRFEGVATENSVLVAFVDVAAS